MCRFLLSQALVETEIHFRKPELTIVTLQNVILTQNVITIAAKCNTNQNVITSTQNVIKYSTQNVITFQCKM